MKRIYRKHSEEFKREVIEYSLKNTKSVIQICREFNISANQFYAWKKKLLGNVVDEGAASDGSNGASQGASPMEMADEIRRLRKELEKSQRREQILKKAALILGEDPQNNMS